MSLLFSMALLVVGVTSAPHGRDSIVCTVPTQSNNGPARPKIPNVYTVNTECNFKDKNRTTEAREWYNAPLNLAKIRLVKEGITSYNLFDYTTNEVLSYNVSASTSPANPPNCHVQDLAASDDQYLFGLQRFTDSSSGIYKPDSVFQFGGSTPEVYLGQQTIRGIPTNAWRSCIYWGSLDVTANVTWYYSAPNAWITASNSSQVPVKCHVTGRRYTNSATFHDFDHVYEFTYFEPKVDDQRHKIWELPPDTVCPGRRNTKPFPQQPQYFKTKSEIVVPKSGFVSFIWEWYDFTTKVSRWQYRPVQTVGKQSSNILYSTFGTNFMTEIHDYNTGLAYIMDNVRGNCTVHPITLGSDGISVDPHHVRMGSGGDLLRYLDPKTLSYAGVKTVRGTICDTWVAVMDNPPNPGLGPNTTFEFYYAQKDWLSAHGYPEGTVLPIMSNINSPSLDYYTMFNVYDYDEDEPSLLNFDTTPCFSQSQKKDVKFVLPGEFKQNVAGKESMFRYFVLVTVSVYTSISPTRVNNIKVDYLDNDDLLVSLRMLDASPVTGDIVDAPYQLPLQDAVQILEFGINTGNFTLDINGVVMRARPYSIKYTDTVIEEHPWKNIKLEYTGGSVVGLGLGMLLVSFVLGFVLLWFIMKRRNASKVV